MINMLILYSLNGFKFMYSLAAHCHCFLLCLVDTLEHVRVTLCPNPVFLLIKIDYCFVFLSCRRYAATFPPFILNAYSVDIKRVMDFNSFSTTYQES